VHSRSIALALAGSLGLVALPLAASTAHAAADTAKPVVRWGSVGGETIVLEPGVTKLVKVKMRVTDNVGVTRVDGLLYAPDQPKVTVKLKRVSGTAKDGIWQGTFSTTLASATLGSWVLKANARDAADNRTGTTATLKRFSLKRQTVLSWQAAQQGTGKVNVRASIGYPQLEDGEWDWDELRGAKIVVEFRKKGTTKWVVQGSPPAVDGGIHYGPMKSPGDGYWRARYYGTSTQAGKISQAIYVDTL
jgi:hypothetical protein